MPRKDSFVDYEYDDDEFNALQNRNYAQRPPRQRPAPPVNPNAQMRYNQLAQNRDPRNRQYDPGAFNQNAHRPPQRPYAYNNGNPAGRPVVVRNNVAAEKKSSPLRIIRNFIIILLVLCIVIVFALNIYIHSIFSNVVFNPDDVGENEFISSSELMSDSSVENILFIGVDSRGEENSRSDTMMLVSIDKKHKKIKMTSFLRDTYVTVPGQGEMKLNAACFYGGPKLVIDTIEYNFKIDIDYYMLVDFEAFIDVVDALGGTDVDVTAAEAKYMREAVKVPWVKEGKNHFNGFVTLWYCRIRYLDSDFNRTERQRKVITNLIESAKEQNIFDLIDIAKEALPYVQTNMNAWQLTFLAEKTGLLLYLMDYEIEQQQVPFKGEYEDRLINEQLVLYIDIPETSEKIIDFIYE